jgi:hypothetical protein
VDELGPTVVYLWDNVASPYATTQHTYVEYNNELDALNPSTVVWEPYLDPEVLGMPLNPMCTQDQELFTIRCPLICFYAVEIHLPHRVACQFGFKQICPHEELSINIDCDKFDRDLADNRNNFVIGLIGCAKEK